MSEFEWTSRDGDAEVRVVDGSIHVLVVERGNPVEMTVQMVDALVKALVEARRIRAALDSQ